MKSPQLLEGKTY